MSTSNIDRHPLVARHNLDWKKLDGTIPLGNGEFCFTADATGLQTFAGNCMAHWGWHSFPLTDGWTESEVPPTGTFERGRCTGPEPFPADARTQSLRAWMFDNPHRLNFARIRFVRGNGAPLAESEVTVFLRRLDLWSGLHEARFTIDSVEVHVETCVHPEFDAVAIRIESELLSSGDIRVAIDAPYPSLKMDPWVGDFGLPEKHQSSLALRSATRAEIARQIDGTVYRYGMEVSANASLKEDDLRPHSYTISASDKILELVCAFAPTALPQELPSFAETKLASSESWETFWNSGGAIDLSESTDPRWMELERRVVLSQYHVAAMSSGSWPPAETALLGIDGWRGQFHMEMVWWHLAHFALWDRWDRATEALQCYERFIPAARALAKQLGYAGLKWPKSVGPEGRSAPWEGNQVLLWKQPHPMFFAELEYRLRPTSETLEKWREVVFGTAEHMADYPTFNARNR